MEVRVGGGIVRVRNIFIISCNQRRIEKEMVINHRESTEISRGGKCVPQTGARVKNIFHNVYKAIPYKISIKKWRKLKILILSLGNSGKAS